MLLASSDTCPQHFIKCELSSVSNNTNRATIHILLQAPNLQAQCPGAPVLHRRFPQTPYKSSVRTLCKRGHFVHDREENNTHPQIVDLLMIYLGFKSHNTKQGSSWNLRRWSSSLWSYFSLCDWPSSVSAAEPFPWSCDTLMRIHWWSCRTCWCSPLELHRGGGP